MRGIKGTVYEGGIRVPFFLRWPGVIQPGAKVDRVAAHIDVLPTLARRLRPSPASDVKFDGRSLWPLLRHEAPNWPDRTLSQWHRGDRPNSSATTPPAISAGNSSTVRNSTTWSDPAEAKRCRRDQPKSSSMRQDTRRGSAMSAPRAATPRPVSTSARRRRTPRAHAPGLARWHWRLGQRQQRPLGCARSRSRQIRHHRGPAIR